MFVLLPNRTDALHHQMWRFLVWMKQNYMLNQISSAVWLYLFLYRAVDEDDSDKKVWMFYCHQRTDALHHHVWTFLQVIPGLKTLNYILIHFFLSDLTLSCSCYILELITIVFWWNGGLELNAPLGFIFSVCDDKCCAPWRLAWSHHLVFPLLGSFTPLLKDGRRLSLLYGLLPENMYGDPRRHQMRLCKVPSIAHTRATSRRFFVTDLL